MSRGLAVVAGNAGGHQDLIVNGENGLLGLDETEFITRLSQLIEDRNLRLKLGENARKLAARYDWNICIGNLLKIYDSIMADDQSSKNLMAG